MHPTKAFYAARFLLVMTAGMLVSICSASGAVDVHGQHEPEGLYPATFVSLSGDHAILVEKSSQKLFLYSAGQSGAELVTSYPCSTGKNQGNKERSGDKKTPEGVYYFKKIYSDEALPSQYGVMAFVMNFPNALDRTYKKGGNGIWLHGLDKPLIPFDSKGCIAMNNKDILELSPYIALHETPIVIQENVDYATRTQIQADQQAVREFMNTWEKSWEDKRLDTYTGCYMPSAFSPGAWKRWRHHKESLSRRYKFIDIDLRDIEVLKHNGTFTVRFVQDYESDAFKSVGFKTLYLARNSADLKIIEEEWKSSPGTAAVSSKEAASAERQLCRFLNSWVAAWEGGRIDDYIACYSQDFSSQGMDRNQWKHYKAGISASTRTIRVVVREPSLDIQGDRAMITYKQEYVADMYTDFGLKKIRAALENGAWKIVAEEWEPL